MSNVQKIILMVVIVVIVIALNIFLEKTLDGIIDDCTEKLLDIKEKISNSEYDEGLNLSKSLNEEWEKDEEKLTLFAEHEEIEKISVKVAIVKENLQNNDYDASDEDIVEAIYLLKHLKDKMKVKLGNVF